MALVIVGLFVGAAYAASSESRSVFRALHWKTGLPIVALAASPWFLWMQWRFGDEFVKGYLLAGNLWYATQPIEFSARAINHTFYIRAFTGAFFPWSIVAVGRGIDIFRRLRANEAVESGAAAVAVDARRRGLLQRGQVQARSLHLPGRAGLLPDRGQGVARGSRDADGYFWGTRYSVLLIAALLIVGGSFGGVALSQLNLGLSAWAFVLPFAVFVGGAVLLAQSERVGWGVPAGAGALLAMLLVSYATVVAVGFPVLEQVRPTARVARHLARISAPTAPVGLYRLERWRGSLRISQSSDRTAGDVRRALKVPLAIGTGLCRHAPSRLRRTLLSPRSRAPVDGTSRGHWHYGARTAATTLGLSCDCLKRSAPPTYESIPQGLCQGLDGLTRLLIVDC